MLFFYTTVFFSLFDSNKLYWITIGANLSFIGYIGVPFLVAGVVLAAYIYTKVAQK
jgi:hypothetical protein